MITKFDCLKYRGKYINYTIIVHGSILNFNEPSLEVYINYTILPYSQYQLVHY